MSVELLARPRERRTPRGFVKVPLLPDEFDYVSCLARDERWVKFFDKRRGESPVLMKASDVARAYELLSADMRADVDVREDPLANKVLAKLVKP